MFVIRGELPKSDNIVIVDIDEASLKEYGQWPWSRDLVSKLLNKTLSHNVGIIGLDMVFAEEDKSSPHRLKEQFPQIKEDLPNYDEILANTFFTSPIIGGYIFLFDEKGSKEAPMIPAIFIQKGLKDNNTTLTPKSAIVNIPILQNSLYSSGFFNNIADENGMIRSVPLVMKYDNVIYPSLALEMFRIYTQENRVTLKGDELGIHNINIGDFKIPTDSFGKLYINFRGAQKHFNYVSALDILKDDVNSSILENKFVLVGTSVLGLYDVRSMVYDTEIPGVEIHANVIDNLLEGDFIYKPLNDVLYNLIIIWGVVFVLMILLTISPSWLTLPLTISLLYGLIYLFYYFLFNYGLILNMLFPILSFLVTLFFSIGIDYILEQNQKKTAKKMLEKKVSKGVMNYLLKHSKDDLVASREVEATIFFSDIRGFTTISETIGSPDKLIKMLNKYMNPMAQSIILHKGTIDKFIGDAIMAYWNAPLEVKNHPDMALKSAIEQLVKLEAINIEIKKEYGVKLDIGIGLHTGLVTAGDMGSKGRSDYTIIGDNVNLASRLEGLTKQYDAKILLSSSTVKALKDNYAIRPIDFVEVKGKTKPVEIFEYMLNEKEENQEYLKALESFRAGKVKEAKEIFNYLNQNYKSKLYELYLKRCNYFIENPNIEFTPILKMKTK